MNESTFVRENVKNKKELRKTYTASNMELVRGSFELADKTEIKLYVPENLEKTVQFNKVMVEYSDCITKNELEANYIWGDRQLSSNKGIILKGDRFYKFTENENGDSVRYITKKDSEFL